MKNNGDVNKVFISWSGNKAKVCADFLTTLFQEIFEKSDIIFYSKQISDGRMWICDIDEALKKSQIGIILLTREDISRPWINFEAGAIYMVSKESIVIPVFIDIESNNIMAEHPLKLFQSTKKFDLDGLVCLSTQTSHIKMCLCTLKIQ